MQVGDLGVGACVVPASDQAAGQMNVLAPQPLAAITLEYQPTVLCVLRKHHSQSWGGGKDAAPQRVVAIGLFTSHLAQSIAEVEAVVEAILQLKVALHVIAQADERVARTIPHIGKAVVRVVPVAMVFDTWSRA